MKQCQSCWTDRHYLMVANGNLCISSHLPPVDGVGLSDMIDIDMNLRQLDKILQLRAEKTGAIKETRAVT